MKTNDLAVRPLISHRDAEKMIWTFIYHGNHSNHDAMKGASKHTIEEWFADNNESLPRLVSRCRSFFTASIPFVENIIGSTWTVVSESGAGVSASMTKGGKNEPEIEIEGSGTIGVDYESNSNLLVAHEIRLLRVHQQRNYILPSLKALLASSHMSLTESMYGIARWPPIHSSLTTKEQRFHSKIRSRTGFQPCRVV